MMRIFLTLLLVFSFCFVEAQERKIINGKVVSRSKRLEGVYVSNINTGEALVTAKGGYFNITARENDTLMFSGPLFIGYRHAIDEVDLKRDIMLIPLEPNELYTELDEIVITKITSESLGLIPKGVRRYTPAERRLYTATSGSGLIPIDAVVNWISGRTKMLKKALVYEKQEMRKEKFLSIVSETKLLEDYSIPKDYLIGFAYYVATDDYMTSLLSASVPNKNGVETRTGELALEFLDLIREKLEEDKKNKIIQ